MSARATDDAAALVSATAVFGAAASPAPPSLRRRRVAPPAPDAPPPDACAVFEPPRELVPFAQHTEIRPVGANRPFAGGDEPELTAWLRLLGDDAAPDEARLVVLMDALAPSYSAVLSTPTPIPTVTLAVHPSARPGDASGPWILVRACTRAASPEGWVDERLDAWAPDGTHVASASQLRLLVGP